jgi:hypothetical protein
MTRSPNLPLLLVFSAVAAITPAQAQFGVKGGLSVSGIIAEDYREVLGYEMEWVQDRDADPHLGFQLGVFYERVLRGRFSIQPEIHAISRGLDWYFTDLYGSSLKARVFYVQVPVFLRYRSLLLGPFASVKLGARRVLSVWDESESAAVPGVARFDFGLTFAISPSVSLWSAPLLLELRFDLGLANIADPPAGATRLYLYSGRAQTVAIALLTGFRF